MRLYYCLRIALKTSVTVPYLNFFQRSLCTDLLCSNLFVEPRHIPVVGALSSKLQERRRMTWSRVSICSVSRVQNRRGSGRG